MALLVAAELPGTRAVELRHGFALVPLVPTAVAALSPGDEEVMSLLVNEPLRPTLADLLRRASARGPVAYVEADFFGGIGQQAAVVWDRGEVVLGPVVDPPPPEPPPSLGESAINQALKRMGVRRGDAVDEFAALDLGCHRETAAWLVESSLG